MEGSLFALHIPKIIWHCTITFDLKILIFLCDVRIYQIIWSIIHDATQISEFVERTYNMILQFWNTFKEDYEKSSQYSWHWRVIFANNLKSLFFSCCSSLMSNHGKRETGTISTGKPCHYPPPCYCNHHHIRHEQKLWRNHFQHYLLYFWNPRIFMTHQDILHRFPCGT